jgi:hypothetical protein
MKCFHIIRWQNFNCFHLCRCIEQINKANRGEISQDELQERQVTLFLYRVPLYVVRAVSDSVLLFGPIISTEQRYARPGNPEHSYGPDHATGT